MIKLQIPATSANLGPGFDSIGVALNLFNYLYVNEIQSDLKIEVCGEGCEQLNCDETNLVYQAMQKIFETVNKKPKGVQIKQFNHIPLSRGLGSSAAAIVGGMVAANKLCGDVLTQEDILYLATEMEGHPDNVAPALLGGIVIANHSNDKIDWIKITPPNSLLAVVAIPDFSLSTETARNVLPSVVPFKDAIFNISKTALLIAALCTGDLDKLTWALEDALHQPYREKLIPGMEKVFAVAKDAGALGCVISGAGPSLIAFTLNHQENIKKEMNRAFMEEGIDSKSIILSLSDKGTVAL